MNKNHPLFPELEKLPEDEVRIGNAAYRWGGPGTDTHAFVSEYLRSLEQEREEESRAKSLSISLEANSIARNALKIAIAAMILSILMATKEIIGWFR